MASWLPFRRPKAPEPDADPAGAPPPVPSSAAEPSQAALGRVVVEVFTADGSGRVGIECGGERITDVLNAATTVRLHGQDGASDEPVDLQTDDLLLVIPPDQATDARRRLHRLRHPLRLRVGPYELTGHLHVPPGAQPSGYLMRVSPHFVPLTGAIIEHAGPEPVARRADVLLVNLRRVEVLKEITEEDALPGTGTA